MILDTVSGWFDDGTIELDDEGKAYITYSMYRDLCTSMYDYVDLKLDLGSSVTHKLLATPFDQLLMLRSVPKLDSYYTSDMTYAPVYYSDTQLYISKRHFLAKSSLNVNSGNSYVRIGVAEGNGLVPYTVAGQSHFGGTYGTEDYFYSEYVPSFHYSSVSSSLNFQYLEWTGDTIIYSCPSDGWYSIDQNANISSCDSSEVDASLSQGYLMCDGYLEDFLDTVTAITAAPDTSQVDDLSDTLDDLLVLNPNPGLVIDPNPAISVPTDAVTITDIPLVDDMTLTDVIADTMPIGLDMQLPKTIFDKFPFSLPFDLYRLLTIFVAEPVTPVFRIPISNVNVDMSAFKDNEMLGEYSYSQTFEPMFEIDEEIVIDFSGLPFIQAISYTCSIVGFIAFLILITTKLIHH